MNREDLEFLISQFLDGTLSPQEASALHALLDQNADARTVLAEYQTLDALMKTSLPRPELNEGQWDAMADQISAAVAEADFAEAIHGENPLRGVEGMRVGDIRLADLKAPRPRGLSIGLFRNFARVAVAASILLAVAAGVRYWSVNGRPASVARVTIPAQPTESRDAVAFVNVVGPAEESPTGPAVDEVSIGPASNLTPAQLESRFADSVVNQGQRVVIASRLQPAQDIVLPY